MMKLEITARNFEADSGIKDYVTDKIGGLERFVPKNMRANAYATVMLNEDENGREDNRFVCDAQLTVEGQKFIAADGTLNMYAAVDIVEAKLKSQLRDFKDKTVKPRRGKSMMNRILRREEIADLETTIQ